MTAEEAAWIMMSGGKKPVLQSIAITQYGDYEIKAPEGVDGYNPIHVNLKDRYDEGYNAAKKIYEKIIEQLNGDGETVTDDNGNPSTTRGAYGKRAILRCLRQKASPICVVPFGNLLFILILLKR